MKTVRSGPEQGHAHQLCSQRPRQETAQRSQDGWVTAAQVSPRLACGAEGAGPTRLYAGGLPSQDRFPETNLWGQRTDQGPRGWGGGG